MSESKLAQVEQQDSGTRGDGYLINLETGDVNGGRVVADDGPSQECSILELEHFDGLLCSGRCLASVFVRRTVTVKSNGCSVEYEVVSRVNGDWVRKTDCHVVYPRLSVVDGQLRSESGKVT